MIDGNTYAINKHLNDQEDYDALQEVTTELEQAEARIEELEAKLAKAVEDLQQLVIEYDEVDLAHDEPPSLTAAVNAARTTLAALKGERNAARNRRGELPKIHNSYACRSRRIRSSLKDRTMSDAMMELPRYQSHKKVWALKISELNYTGTPEQESAGSLMMVPENSSYAPIELDAEFVRKHQPKAGGYWVRYEGGYTSFSPAEAFESGYTIIPQQ